jgi:hypothetical protein
MPGQGQVYQDNGTLSIERCLRTNIWLDVMKEDVHLPTNVNISMNNNVITARSYQSVWTAPADQMYGLVAANNTGTGTSYYLTVNGVGGDTTGIRTQTGVLLNDIQAPLANMTLNNLAYGAVLRNGQALLSGNAFTNCLHSLRIRPNTSAYTTSLDISCNSFGGVITGNSLVSSAIYIEPGATLNDQGSSSCPVENKFKNYTYLGVPGARSIINDGSNQNFKYYRYPNSIHEEIAFIKNRPATQFRGTVIDATNAPYALPNYCINLRSELTGLQQRGTSQRVRMQALMDTLRRQAAPAARLGRYQAAIRNWLLQEQPDTAALDAYVRTLPVANPNAFYGLCLDLLEQYRRAGRSGFAAALRPVLAARISAYPAASARLALSDVVNRIKQVDEPSPGQQQISAADSLVLHHLARTPGGTAEMAAQWFNYLYPRTGLRAATPRPAPADGTIATEQLTTVQALYPNPATDQLHIEISAPTGQAVLRLTNLLSGKLMLQAELKADGKGMQQADLSVQSIPAGQYAAAILVDGLPVSTQKVLINR